MHQGLAIIRAAVALSVVGGVASSARAHIQLLNPSTRTGSQKDGPCGAPGRKNVTVYKPGSTIEVRWAETVQHPGHFRIAFDIEGDDDFGVPPTETHTCSNPSVILDDIPDTTDTNYSVLLKLPDVECDRCTLQLIQLMTDKLPYTIEDTAAGNDRYYQCADIVLSSTDPSALGDGGTEPAPDYTGTGIEVCAGFDPLFGDDEGEPQPGGGGGDDGGCAGVAGAWWGALLCLALVGGRIRRRQS